MKMLYAIQGTGNGHVARAEDIIPILQEYGDLDVFISGSQADLNVSFPVKYTSKGLSFYFGKYGGIDYLKTFKRNSSKAVLDEIKKFPAEKYAIILNDFEPISAWAARKKDIPCISLSHQASLLSVNCPKPKQYDPVGDWLLHHYAPSKAYVGFHFANFDTAIYTPVIRKAIRSTEGKAGEHYTVYLPAYDDKVLVPILAKVPDVRWHIFSKHARVPYHFGRLSVYPVNNEEFVASMISAKGVLCGAGFETPAETLFLGKQLMVVPMKKQYEQHYNAAALRELGVPVLKNIKPKRIPELIKWVESDHTIKMDYPDTTRQAIEHALKLGGYPL